MSALFECAADSEQRRVLEVAAYEHHSDWQAVRQRAWNAEPRMAGHVEWRGIGDHRIRSVRILARRLHRRGRHHQRIASLERVIVQSTQLRAIVLGLGINAAIESPRSKLAQDEHQ